MADFTDRIKLIVETVADKATKDLKGVSSEIGNAEGAFGKAKAAAGGFGQILSANVGLSAAAAGTAVAAFVGDAIGKFQTLALEAGKVAAATGLSVEQASRWMEVAGDLGVNTEALQSAMGRLNKAAGEGKLAKLGIDADNANDRLLNTLAYINSIPDSADRAKAGVDLLGKGWQTLAPLVEEAGNLKQSLADVGSGQVIDEGELRKARELRDVMDELSDAWDGFVLTVGGSAGELVTDIGKIASGIKDVADGITSVIPGGDNLVGNIVETLNPLHQLQNGLGAVAGMFDESKGWGDRFENLGHAAVTNVPLLGGLVDSIWSVDDASTAAEDSTEGLASASHIAADAAEAEATAQEAVNKAIQDATSARLAAISASLSYADAQDKTKEALDKANLAMLAAATAGGTNEEANTKAAAAMRDAEQAAIAEANASLKLAQETANADGYTLSAAQSNAILAANLRATASTLAPGNPLRTNLEGYANKLDEIPEDVTTDANFNDAAARAKIDALVAKIRGLDTEIFFGGGTGGLPSSGTRGAPSPTGALLGAAPLVAVPRVPMASPTATTHYSITVQAPPNLNMAELGRVVTDAIDAFERRSGSRRRVA